LTIAGKRESEKEEKKGKVTSSARCSDQLLRIVDLPTEIETAKVTATLKNGVSEPHHAKGGEGSERQDSAKDCLKQSSSLVRVMSGHAPRGEIARTVRPPRAKFLRN